MSTLLRSGSTGAPVTHLQQLLARAGYVLTPDGSFGKQTEMAVKRFQQQQGLTPDGIAGEQTVAALEKATAANAGAAATTAAAAAVTPPSPAGSVNRLTEKDLQDAAYILKVEPAALKAVCSVETGDRSGFLHDGRPLILFEGHVFWQQLKKAGIAPEKHLAGNEDILYPSWTKSHYKGGAGEYDRLEKAKAIHTESALASASWGLFQIMAFNYGTCGHDSVQSYVDAQFKGEREQLFCMVNFLKHGNCLTPLQNLDWAGFAKRYNGPAYAANKYDLKLKQAYEKHSR